MKKSKKRLTPENRRKTGVTKLRGGLDPAIGKQTQFKPGKTGNAGGRPRALISDASRDWLKQIDEKTGKSNAQLVSDAQGKKALDGDTSSYCAIRDTTEGRPAQTQQHEVISNTAIKVEIEAPNLIAAIRQIYGLSDSDPNQPSKTQPLSEGVDRGQGAAQDSNQSP